MKYLRWDVIKLKLMLSATNLELKNWLYIGYINWLIGV